MKYWEPLSAAVQWKFGDTSQRWYNFSKYCEMAEERHRDTDIEHTAVHCNE